MYTPTHFRLDDSAQAMEFMQRYNFATLVTVVDGRPFASHLPFVVEATAEGTLRLLAHMARPNPQWQTLEAQTALAIFAEPHAYVSPSLYEKTQNVPTWNYVAVHAYGRTRLLLDDADAFALLERQMQVFENQYLEQWNTLPDTYKNALAKGIVAFEMEVTQLEGKQKLSQNKTDRDRQNVMQHLLDSTDDSARAIGEMMQHLP
jgi:transcriptional regulator